MVEIAEECKESKDLIITTIKEMIEGEEIHARYFESSNAVAFDLQANVAEIDKLMDHFKQWELDDKGKKE